MMLAFGQVFLWVQQSRRKPTFGVLGVSTDPPNTPTHNARNGARNGCTVARIASTLGIGFTQVDLKPKYAFIQIVLTRSVLPGRHSQKCIEVTRRYTPG